MAFDIVNNVKAIFEDESLVESLKSGTFDIAQALIFRDIDSGVNGVREIAGAICSIPTALFLGKFRRFLSGTFKSFDEQEKLAEKINKSNNNYYQNVKNIIQLIDNLEDDKKVDYFSSLTRCLLLTDLTVDLYYHLAKCLTSCTTFDLEYIRKLSYKSNLKRDFINTSLFYQRLFDRVPNNPNSIALSGLGIALKQNCLNFEDGLNGEIRLTSFDMLSALELNSPAVFC